MNVITCIPMLRKQGNMEQDEDAHSKNAGSYVYNQWMKLSEIDAWPKPHRVLDIQIFWS